MKQKIKRALIIILIIQVSLIVIFLIYFLSINTDNQVYKFLANPIWGSLGAIVTGSGVFLGAKLGLKSAFELEKKKAADEAEVKWKAFMREVLHNEETLYKAHDHLHRVSSDRTTGYSIDDPDQITPDAFNAVKIAISHIKRGAWEEFLKVNTSDQFSPGKFTPDLIATCVDYEYALSKIIRNIELEIWEFERISEHNLLGDKESVRSYFYEVRKIVENNLNHALKAKSKIDDLIKPTLQSQHDNDCLFSKTENVR